MSANKKSTPSDTSLSFTHWYHCPLRVKVKALQLHILISFLLHAACHVYLMFPFLLPCAGCMVSKGPQNKSEAFPCAPMACLSFQMEIEGHVYPWGVSGDQGASVAPAAPGASVFPLRGSWTVTHTKHRVHHKSLCPAVSCLVHTVIGKALKALRASLVSSRLCVSGVCVLGLAVFEKIRQ